MKTNVFVSWSRDLSKEIAKEVSKWIPEVLQTIEPFYSEVDITSGKLWADEIQRGLNDTNIGVICLTKDCLDSPWVHFEAGAIFKGMKDTSIHILLFEVAKKEVKQPLSLFQSKIYDREQFRSFMWAVNLSNQITELILTKESFDSAFDDKWDKFKSKIDAILASHVESTNEKSRSTEEMVEEILNLVRSNQRSSPGVTEFDRVSSGFFRNASGYIKTMQNHMPSECDLSFQVAFKVLKEECEAIQNVNLMNAFEKTIDPRNIFAHSGPDLGAMEKLLNQKYKEEPPLSDP